jgi:hypothetical protein
MPSARTSFHALAHITEIAARAPQFVSALETVVCESGRVLQTDVYALELVEQHWSVAAATPKAPPLSRAFLAQLTLPDSYTPAVHRDPAGRDWLAISLSTPWAAGIALLLPHDRIDSHDLLSDWARLTAFALGALRERDLRRKAEQLVGGSRPRGGSAAWERSTSWRSESSTRSRACSPPAASRWRSTGRPRIF